LILVDANLLVYARVRSLAQHEAARAWLDGRLNGTVRVERIWDAFWSGGISNPLEVIEQITYLLFLRRLDDLHTLEENKSARLKRPMERRIGEGRLCYADRLDPQIAAFVL
jgi:predicted nucleic acid-binding protein